MDLLTSGYQCFKNAFLLPYFYFHPMLADNAEKRYSKKWRDLLHTTTKARKRNESTISKYGCRKCCVNLQNIHTL